MALSILCAPSAPALARIGGTVDECHDASILEIIRAIYVENFFVMHKLMDPESLEAHHKRIALGAADAGIGVAAGAYTGFFVGMIATSATGPFALVGGAVGALVGGVIGGVGAGGVATVAQRKGFSQFQHWVYCHKSYRILKLAETRYCSLLNQSGIEDGVTKTISPCPMLNSSAQSFDLASFFEDLAYKQKQARDTGKPVAEVVDFSTGDSIAAHFVPDIALWIRIHKMAIAIVSSFMKATHLSRKDNECLIKFSLDLQEECDYLRPATEQAIREVLQHSPAMRLKSEAAREAEVKRKMTEVDDISRFVRIQGPSPTAEDLQSHVLPKKKEDS